MSFAPQVDLWLALGPQYRTRAEVARAVLVGKFIQHLIESVYRELSFDGRETKYRLRPASDAPPTVSLAGVAQCIACRADTRRQRRIGSAGR